VYQKLATQIIEPYNRGDMKVNLTQISEAIVAVKTDFLFKTQFFPTHVFVLKTHTGLILFDTGSPGCGTMILNSITAAVLDPGKISAICLSHWHGDHTGSLAEILGLLDQEIDIFIGRADLPFLTAQQIRLLRFHPRLNLPIPHGPGKLPGASSARLLPLDTKGDDLLFQKYRIKAVPTPGHTPGHTAYLHPETGALFSGCALSLLTPSLAGLVPIFHNREEMIRSGELLAQMDFQYLCPVHLFLPSGKIPLEKRGPVKGNQGLVSRLMGDHLLFQICM